MKSIKLIKKPNKAAIVTENEIIHYRKIKQKLEEFDREPLRLANRWINKCMQGHVNCLLLQGYEVVNGK